MKRLRRWLLNLAAAVSLLIGILIAIVWIRSEFVLEGIQFNMPPNIFERYYVFAETRPGALCFESMTEVWGSRDVTRQVIVRLRSLSRINCRRSARDRASFPEQLSFRWETTTFLMTIGPNAMQARLVVPDWFLLMGSGMLPTIWLIKFRRRSKRAGYCTKCGYDLRATPDRCPECGTIPTAPEEKTMKRPRRWLFNDAVQ